jgi:hypothetical protein
MEKELGVPIEEGCWRLCVVVRDLDTEEHMQPGCPPVEEHGCRRAREAAAEVDARERARACEFGGRGRRGSAGGRDASQSAWPGRRSSNPSPRRNRQSATRAGEVGGTGPRRCSGRAAGAASLIWANLSRPGGLRKGSGWVTGDGGAAR